MDGVRRPYHGHRYIPLRLKGWGGGGGGGGGDGGNVVMRMGTLQQPFRVLLYLTAQSSGHLSAIQYSAP